MSHHGSIFRVRDRLSKHFGDSLSPEDAYLSYYDVRLTREDVDDVKHGDWFTDNAIAFWEEYLERDCFSSFPSAHIILLRPSMVFMIQQTPDVMTLKDALPPFKETTHIFCPINDCTSSNLPEGGSHWSLLVLSLRDKVAFHYTSLAGGNVPNAQVVTRKLSTLLGVEAMFKDLENSPQQENGTDCGAFVCEEMELLLKKRLYGARSFQPLESADNDGSLTKASTEKTSMSIEGDEINASKFRRRFIRVVDDFRKEGKARRSSSRSPSRSSRSKSRTPPRVGD